jgi:hypothetical protein
MNNMNLNNRKYDVNKTLKQTLKSITNKYQIKRFNRVIKICKRYFEVLSNKEKMFIISLQHSPTISLKQSKVIEEMYIKYQNKFDKVDNEIYKKTNSHTSNMKILMENDFNTLSPRNQSLIIAYRKKDMNRGFKIIYQILINDNLYFNIPPDERETLHNLSKWKLKGTNEDRIFVNQMKEYKKNLQTKVGGVK